MLLVPPSGFAVGRMIWICPVSLPFLTSIRYASYWPTRPPPPPWETHPSLPEASSMALVSTSEIDASAIVDVDFGLLSAGCGVSSDFGAALADGSALAEAVASGVALGADDGDGPGFWAGDDEEPHATAKS